jgi:hypothetical protein
LTEFQAQSSHLAFVAENPALLSAALDEFANMQVYAEDERAARALKAIKKAGILGVIGLESVVETVLSGKVYDEGARKRAKKIVGNFLRTWALPRLRKAAQKRKAPVRSQLVVAHVANWLRSSTSSPGLRQSAQQTRLSAQAPLPLLRTSQANCRDSSAGRAVPAAAAGARPSGGGGRCQSERERSGSNREIEFKENPLRPSMSQKEASAAAPGAEAAATYV